MNYIKFWEIAVSMEGLILDSWQEQVMAHEGNTVLRTGRQVGKTQITSRKATKLAFLYAGTETLIIAASQRQSSHIFQKMMWIFNKIDELILQDAKVEFAEEWERCKTRRDLIGRFNLDHGLFIERPTKTKTMLKNGSTIHCLPAGKTGVYLRCFTIDFLIADEAAYIPDPVFVAVKPMLAVSKKLRGLGWETYLSTPFGKGGYFYDCCHDTDFLQIHVSSEDCPRIPRDFLKKERIKLTRVEYAQEYLGEFIDEFNQLFSTELIKKRMTFINWDKVIHKDRSYYLGLDVARYGGDENAFVIAELYRNQSKGRNHVRIIYTDTTERKGITDTVARVVSLQKMFNFRRIFVDSSGVGGGLYDILVEKLSKRLVVGLENARRSIDNEGRVGKLFKEDLYSNAIVLMEQEPQEIEIISNISLLRSLKSMTFEYTSERNIKIFGNYSHLAEAFVRACWCVKTKGLNLFIS